MKKVYSILSILITIMIPFFLIMGSIRILINPIYLDYARYAKHKGKLVMQV